jgi:hypothetical protein
LNWCDPTYADLFTEDWKPAKAFAYVMGRDRVYKVSPARRLPD